MIDTSLHLSKPKEWIAEIINSNVKKHYSLADVNKCLLALDKKPAGASDSEKLTRNNYNRMMNFLMASHCVSSTTKSSPLHVISFILHFPISPMYCKWLVVNTATWGNFSACWSTQKICLEEPTKLEINL